MYSPALRMTCTGMFMLMWTCESFIVWGNVKKWSSILHVLPVDGCNMCNCLVATQSVDSSEWTSSALCLWIHVTNVFTSRRWWSGKNKRNSVTVECGYRSNLLMSNRPPAGRRKRDFVTHVVHRWGKIFKLLSLSCIIIISHVSNDNIDSQ